MTTPAPFTCNSSKFNVQTFEKPRWKETDLNAHFNYLIVNKPEPPSCVNTRADIDVSTNLRWPTGIAPSTPLPSHSIKRQTTALDSVCCDPRSVKFIQPFSRACEEPINIASVQGQSTRPLQGSYVNMTVFATHHDAETYRNIQQQKFNSAYQK
jgi:hypothetical protein